MIGPPVFMFMAPSKKIQCVSIWHLNLKKRLHVNTVVLYCQVTRSEF